MSEESWTDKAEEAIEKFGLARCMGRICVEANEVKDVIKDGSAEVKDEVEDEFEKLTGKPTSIISGLVGNVMEWYDFALYGYMVPVLSLLFFPSDSQLASVMATFAVFAAGFLMRPLGGFILGHIGDVKGRKTTLYLSMVLMAVSTTLLGVLPTYQAVGLLAPALLLVLRLFQGLSVGGEFSSSVTYMVEEATSDSRGIFGSLANIGSMSGMVLGSGVAAAVTTLLPEAALHDWGWRLPFFLAAGLGVFGVYFTSKLPESHMFKREKRHTEASPIKEILSEGRSEFLQAMLFCLGYAVLFYIPLVYMPTFVDTVAGMDTDKALQITTIVTAALVFVIPLMAAFSDKFIRRKWMLLGAFGAALVLAYPLTAAAVQNYTMLLLAELVFGFLIAVPLGVMPSTLVEQFPTKYRLTSYSIVYNVSLGVFGGTAPMVATWLIQVTGNKFAIIFYLCVTVLISIIGLLLMKDRSREPLR